MDWESHLENFTYFDVEVNANIFGEEVNMVGDSLFVDIFKMFWKLNH